MQENKEYLRQLIWEECEKSRFPDYLTSTDLESGLLQENTARDASVDVIWGIVDVAFLIVDIVSFGASTAPQAGLKTAVKEGLKALKGAPTKFVLQFLKNTFIPNLGKMFEGKAGSFVVGIIDAFFKGLFARAIIYNPIKESKQTFGNNISLPFRFINASQRTGAGFTRGAGKVLHTAGDLLFSPITSGLKYSSDKLYNTCRRLSDELTKYYDAEWKKKKPELEQETLSKVADYLNGTRLWGWVKKAVLATVKINLIPLSLVIMRYLDSRFETDAIVLLPTCIQDAQEYASSNAKIEQLLQTLVSDVFHAYSDFFTKSIKGGTTKIIQQNIVTNAVELFQQLGLSENYYINVAKQYGGLEMGQSSGNSLRVQPAMDTDDAEENDVTYGLDTIDIADFDLSKLGIV